MASWPRFRALWIYRFHKYTHRLGKVWSFLRKYLYLRLLKARLGNRRIVAIILSEQMGDIIACEPVAREVRRQHPHEYIIWVVREPYLELVRYHPDLDGFLIEKCPSERDWLLKAGVYDVVYNMHISHRKCRYCGGDPVNPTADKLGLTFDNYYDQGDLLYVFSQAAGLPALTDDPKMYIPDSVRSQVASLHLPPRPIVIHCQSSHVLRDWPAEHWNQLVSWLLANYPHSIVEVGLQPVVNLEHPRFRSLCGQLNLLETAAVIEQARLFIGIDSGPAHMANAGHIDGVILLGQLFNFVRYLPYSGRYKRGDGVTIVNNIGHPCAELPYAWVQRAVEQRLGQPKLV
ncbi:glycosyltransferase family 9 protein [Spirosoma montaniterrae]|uniref:Glycosyl transferase n=1 Tax=Spirosoma montaniterrae TaxID=1178516 RepID=A0A1P9WWC6_9BACT|nr:glycosyltransferase family 9 protein [Spirosoma montaniterrae]AQG79663.1 glycosyl transferase [Spirosoma montaniterrae]